MKKFCFILLGLTLTSTSIALTEKNELKTIAEKSNWLKTGRSDETEKLCHNFHNKFPKLVKCITYGITPEKRKLKALQIGYFKKGAPVIWAQAGIHAGEIDGKDGVFLLIKEILEQKKSPHLFDKVNLVFIPIVNLDGHERFGKWNRPNQNGPIEMGWRTTAQNYNLNRDFAKLDAPEMQDLIKLWTKTNPMISLDLHVTDGADFQAEVGIVTNPTIHSGNSPLHQMGSEVESVIIEKMKEQKHLALPFYPIFEIEDDPLSGFMRYIASMRFSHGYWYNQNRIGILVETHSWKDYKTRLMLQHDIVKNVLEGAYKNATKWSEAIRKTDQELIAGKEVPLEYKHSEKFTMIDFPGYEYKKIKSLVSDQDVIQYDRQKPMNWHVRLHEELIPSLTVQAPLEGYFIPLSRVQTILEKIKIHGIKFEILKKNTLRNFYVFRAKEAHFEPISFEGHQELKVKGTWIQETRELLAGSIFIPIKQARARLMLQLFEPQARDSFLSWGFFNNAFEKKEYMEHYVAEDVAKEMLKDPKIKDEFETRLKNDEAFAKDAAKRFEFFHQKHESWDKEFNLYPIFKI